jgi:hypothetical protein
MKHTQTLFQTNSLSELRHDGQRFYPTVRDINEWFSIINYQLFSNQLPPFDRVCIKTYPDCHALFQSWEENKGSVVMLEMGKSFADKKTFIEILAHEMIHLYQHIHNEGEGEDHGPTFRKWRNKFMQNGLRLRKGLETA